MDLGRGLDADRVEVKDRTATFRAGEPLAFALFLTGAPGPTELTLVLLRSRRGIPPARPSSVGAATWSSPSATSSGAAPASSCPT